MDDEPDVVDLIADILARDRYEVIVAGTAQEALERISETDVSCSSDGSEHAGDERPLICSRRSANARRNSRNVLPL